MNDTTATTAKPQRPATTATRVRNSVTSTLNRGRETLHDGVGTLRAKADDAVSASVTAVDQSPLTAIAGAIAIGAAVGALLPATTQEERAIGPVGHRIRGAIDASFAAAKSAGAEQLTMRGLTTSALSTGLSGILVSIIQASLAASKPPSSQGAMTTTQPGDPVPHS